MLKVTTAPLYVLYRKTRHIIALQMQNLSPPSNCLAFAISTLGALWIVGNNRKMGGQLHTGFIQLIIAYRPIDDVDRFSAPAFFYPFSMNTEYSAPSAFCVRDRRDRISTAHLCPTLPGIVNSGTRSLT
jgi:hypothetical protein